MREESIDTPDQEHAISEGRCGATGARGFQTIFWRVRIVHITQSVLPAELIGEYSCQDETDDEVPLWLRCLDMTSAVERSDPRAALARNTAGTRFANVGWE
jgi:hypothetical protein